VRCWLAHQSELDQEDLHSTHGSDLTYYDPIAQVAAATRRQEEAEAAALAAETAAVEADALDATDPYVAAVPAGTPQRRRSHTAPNEPLEPWGTGEDAAGQADVGGRWGGPTASARSPLPVPRRPDHAAPHERGSRPHPASPAVQHGAARTPSSAATAAEAASGDVVGALKAFPGRSRTAALGRADNAPQLTPEQQVWVDRRQRSHVTDRWGHWEECHDVDTGDVFYFNHKKLTGVLHKDQTDHPTVIPLSQRVRGKEQWAREDPQFEQDGTAKAWKAATKKFVKRQQRNALRENVARQREQLAESTSRTRRHGLREAQQHRRAHKLRVHQAQMEERAEHMLNLRHKQATIRAMNEAVRPAAVGGSPRGFATDMPCCCCCPCLQRRRNRAKMPFNMVGKQDKYHGPYLGPGPLSPPPQEAPKPPSKFVYDGRTGRRRRREDGEDTLQAWDFGGETWQRGGTGGLGATTRGGVPQEEALLERVMREIKAIAANRSGWNLRRPFARFDKDGSRRLSPKELASALRGLGVPSDPDTVNAVMKAFDTNGDGFIDFGELTFVFMNRRKLVRGVLQWGY